MVTNGNFRLINDLYDNIALLDHNLKLVFQGSLLQKLLLKNHYDLSKIDSTAPTEDLLLKEIKKAASTIQASDLPYEINVPDVQEELILYKASDKNYFFGKKENILHFIKIEHDLGERVKELECLYNISSEYDSMMDLDIFFEKCPGIIEEGFQYPEETIVNIVLNNKTYGNPDWSQKVITDTLSAEVFVNKKKKGEINVYIKKGLDFLEEEKKLIEEVAHKFSKILEKKEEALNLEKQKKILTAKNEALFRMTEECHQKREQLKTFIHAIADKITVVDRDFNVLMSNKDEIGEGGKCYVKLFNSDQQCTDCPAIHTFETSNDSNVEKRLNDRYFTLSAHPIFADDGSVDRVLEVCRDITDRKRMESQMFQSYKLASLGKLVAGVAHEINNPNTFILGNLKIVQEAFEDIFPILDKQFVGNNELKIARLNYNLFKENINILVRDMVNGANRTKKIVEDLRNFAKKDEEELNDDIDLNYIIKNNLTLTKKHIKKYAQLEIEFNENIPLFKGNANKIEQVLLNLTMNASEAVEDGQGLIKIKTDYDESANEIVLCISDNGCGIDDNVIKYIFDPFFTTKRNKGGIGLGLSITYGIVKDHGGKIEVDSKKGSGTTFTIRFPVKRGN